MYAAQKTSGIQRRRLTPGLPLRKLGGRRNQTVFLGTLTIDYQRYTPAELVQLT
jgi:hypothetical protein